VDNEVGQMRTNALHLKMDLLNLSLTKVFHHGFALSNASVHGLWCFSFNNQGDIKELLEAVADRGRLSSSSRDVVFTESVRSSAMIFIEELN
jgi:hypothetical protein